MLTEVMHFYGLARPPTDAGFFETEHRAQVARDIHAAIMGGRLIAVTAVIGSGKTVMSRRLRADLEREGRVDRVSLAVGRQGQDHRSPPARGPLLRLDAGEGGQDLQPVGAS